ncbi:MAG TPA: hypothetical protein VKS80_03795 [Trinickia sp.]|nr:hypothetical protein [Trinickia sp.]
MNVISTEIDFTLPIGYRDAEGTLHRQGVMRLATAADEILPLRDHRVQGNPGYLSVIVLSRVVTQLGNLDMINTNVIENLFTADFAYLQELYNQINYPGEFANDTQHVPAAGAEAAPLGKLRSL